MSIVSWICTLKFDALAQMSVLDSLSQLALNQHIFLSRTSNNQLFYGALVHLLFMLSERHLVTTCKQLERGSAQVYAVAQKSIFRSQCALKTFGAYYGSKRRACLRKSSNGMWIWTCIRQEPPVGRRQTSIGCNSSKHRPNMVEANKHIRTLESDSFHNKSNRSWPKWPKRVSRGWPVGNPWCIRLVVSQSRFDWKGWKSTQRYSRILFDKDILDFLYVDSSAY